jgi:hypothetical protein
MEEKKLIQDGNAYSFFVPDDEVIIELRYDPDRASRLILLNASSELKSKAQLLDIYYIIEWKFTVEDVENNHATDWQVLDYLKRKSEDNKLELSNQNFEEIIHLENLYCKLIGVIPD